MTSAKQMTTATTKCQTMVLEGGWLSAFSVCDKGSRSSDSRRAVAVASQERDVQVLGVLGVPYESKNHV